MYTNSLNYIVIKATSKGAYIVSQFFEFVINHWILWSLFLVVILVIIFEEIRGRVSGIARVQPSELVQKINRDEGTIIDLRDSNAFLKGHIIGAMNIPHTQLDANLEKLKKYQGKPIVLVCATGQTSPQEGAKLKSKGFENVSFLSGGMRAWQQAQLPLTKD